MSASVRRMSSLRIIDNISAIVERCRRVHARDMARPAGLSAREWLAILGASAVLVLIVGIAFDTVSVARARALPPFIRAMFSFVSNAGRSQWELWPAGLFTLFLLLCRWERVSKWALVFWAQIGALSFFIFASIGGAGLLVNILKQPIGRGRPITFDAFHSFVLKPFQFSYDFQSFPSGHSTTGGALIAIGFLIFTRWRIGFMWFGLLIGVSRIAVEAHYPSDVVAGWILGFGFTLWLAAVFANYGWAFRRTVTGSIRVRLGAIRAAARSPVRTGFVVIGLIDAVTGRKQFDNGARRGRKGMS